MLRYTVGIISSTYLGFLRGSLTSGLRSQNRKITYLYWNLHIEEGSRRYINIFQVLGIYMVVRCTYVLVCKFARSLMMAHIIPLNISNRSHTTNLTANCRDQANIIMLLVMMVVGKMKNNFHERHL